MITDNNSNLRQRLSKYNRIATYLENLNDQQLREILYEATTLHQGIGGKSVLTSFDDCQIFVKKIPLTDIELISKNSMSTKNLFELPLCYQYGVGSAGFSAWRELRAHTISTNWVLEGKSENFPLMYHYRILTYNNEDLENSFFNDIEKYVEYWENSNAVRKRVEGLKDASSYVALFLEYVPYNLFNWLTDKLVQGGDIADSAVLFSLNQLKAASLCMRNHGLIHFDAHFENILTCGQRIYVSDFGLALSLQFELNRNEINFLDKHYNFDKACIIVNLLNAVIRSYFSIDIKGYSGPASWTMLMREYIDGKRGNLSPIVDEIIRKYAPIALLMDEFFQKLRDEDKSTLYPTQKIEKLLHSTF